MYMIMKLYYDILLYYYYGNVLNKSRQDLTPAGFFTDSHIIYRARPRVNNYIK